MGTAAIGEELAPLVVAGAVQVGEFVDRGREFGEAAFAGYLDGLHDAGWTGDPRLARLGYTAGTIRFSLVLYSLMGAATPSFLPRFELTWGPIGDIVDRSAAVRPYALDLADEARELMATLSVA